MQNGIITLLGTLIMTLFKDVFRFAIIVEQLDKYIFTISMFISFLVSFFLHIMHHAAFETNVASLKWFIFSQLSHLFPYAGHHLSLWTWLQYLHLFMGSFTGLACFVCPCLPSSFYSIASRFLPHASCWLLLHGLSELQLFLPRLTHGHWASSYSYCF